MTQGWRLLSTLALAVIVAVVVRTIALGVFMIPTRSMEPTLLAGDVVLVCKVSYWLGMPPTIPLTDIVLSHPPRLRWRYPERGELIVFRFAYHANVATEHEYFVKRIVGMPGDTIWVVGDSVYRLPPQRRYRQRERYDGFILVPKEGTSIQLTTTNVQYWKPFIEREGHRIEVVRGVVLLDGQSMTTYTFQQNFYYVLGDNRAHSFDSRVWGFVAESDIVGKPLLVVWSRSPVLGHVRWSRLGVVPQ
jgi:signal peptidase I